MENISGITASQRVNHHCFKPKVQAVSTPVYRSSPTSLVPLAAGAFTSRAELNLPPRYLHPLGTVPSPLLLYPQGALCSDAQHGKDLSRKWQTVFVSMKATPWARQRALRGRHALAGW